MERLVELRTVPDGSRTIEGTVVSYGDVAKLPWGSERFVRGGITWNDDTMLTVQHDRTKALARVGAGLTLEDGPEALTMRATMPNTTLGNDTLELVRAGVLRGLSLEFIPTRTRNEGRVSVVEAARMSGLSVVDVPAYAASVIEREKRERAKQSPRVRVWL